MNIANRCISTDARRRAEKLLRELSLEEKVRQLGCTTLLSEDKLPEEKDLAGGIGAIALLDICEEPEALAARLKKLQQYVMEHSEHHIPALFHCEALGGPVVPKTVLYPNSIGLGATFDPALVRDMADTIRMQMRAMGILHALSPVLDVAKDLRWGRVNETYGGDPTLSAAMSCAFVEGLQGSDLSTGVAATAKHFLGYSQTVGGLNLTRTQADARELREVFAKPFEAAIRKAGIRTVMNSYSEWEGRPVCASRALLTDLLRGELGFDGLVVSDYRSIQRLCGDILATADDITDAAIQCLTAGLDMELPDRLGYAEGLVQAFADGRLDTAFLDRAVLRVLTLKYELGLFDEPYPQWQQYCGAFTDTSAGEKRATRESITMTKNEHDLLPLRDRSIRLAVIGPGGSSLRLLYGGYTQPSMLEMFQVVQDSSEMAGVGSKDAPKPVRKYDLAATDREIRKVRPEAKTIFEALQEYYPNCTYTQGCDYLDPTQTDFAAAQTAAEGADAVILCLSGKNGWGRHCNTGEGNDSASLDLPGAQEELARIVMAANPRTVVVHTDGRPLTSPHIYNNAAAILEAFTPGTWGGSELAAIIAGRCSPAGCLPLALPRTAGHEPMFMAEHRGTTGQSFVAGSLNPDGYWQSDLRPLRPFGYGLSYTTFAYEDFSVQVAPDGTATARVTVRNTGSCDGETVVQLYGRDMIASIVRPEQELLGFARIAIACGQRRTVCFRFHLNQMAFPDEHGRWHVEAGRFRFFAGPNSADLPLTAEYTQPVTYEVLPEAREYFADWQLTEA